MSANDPKRTSLPNGTEEPEPPVPPRLLAKFARFVLLSGIFPPHTEPEEFGRIDEHRYQFCCRPFALSIFSHSSNRVNGSRCCVKPGSRASRRGRARHPACGQTDAEFSELRFGRHFFAAEIRCALPNSADGLVICEGQHQLRHVVLWKARIILDADVTGTWRALGSELQRSEEAIPKSEEQSEVDISLSSPVDVVKPVHSTYRQELLKLAKLVVGI